jgi:hypothetical protein
MGLDNIPHVYPCRKNNTAVFVTHEDGSESIDCEATQAKNGCPYVEHFGNVTEEITPTYGIFGVACWYRGKWGNAILRELSEDDTITFYGDNDDESYKSPSDCIRTAEHIETLYEGTDHVYCYDQNVVPDLRYAAMWLRWVAEHADGSTCWY